MRSEQDLASALAELTGRVQDGQVDFVPLQQLLARGLGEPVYLAPDCIYLRGIGADGGFLWAADPRLAAQVLAEYVPPALLAITGREAQQAAQQAYPGRCTFIEHLICAYLEPHAPHVKSPLCVRPLTPDYAQTVLSHYSHPEFFTLEEIVRRLAAGTVDGGFLGDELVGFIGLHDEGSMGMLEVFPQYRGRGFARQLEAAKIGAQLERGLIPWAQIFPDNTASIHLQKVLGLRFEHMAQGFVQCSK